MKKSTQPVSVSTIPSGRMPSSESLPTRIKILDWGTNPNAHGKTIILDERALAIRNEPTFGFGQIALDFEHNTLPGTPAFLSSKEPRDVAGFGDIEFIPGDGAYLTGIVYTDIGKAKAKNYIDVSAGVIPDAQGHVLMIHSVALCRNGAVPGMTFDNVPLSLSGSVAGLLQSQIKESPMELSPEQVEEVKTILGLKDEVSPDSMIEAIKTVIDQMQATNSEIANLRHAAETDEDAKKKSDELALGLSARLDAIEKQQIIDRATTEGKAIGLSADTIAIMTLDQIKKHVASLAATVPLSAVTPTSIIDPPRKVITEQQRRIALYCGLNPDKDL